MPSIATHPIVARALIRWAGRESFALGAGLLLTLLLFVPVWYLFPVAYGSNDDPVRSMIVSGVGFAMTPDDHLLFSNVVFGRLLRTLYRLWPDWPWYGYALAALNAVAHAVTAQAALRTRSGVALLPLYLGYLATTGILLATTLQFTMTAFALAQAGLLLAVSLISRPAEGYRAWLLASVAVIVAMAGALVRFDAFAAALALLSVPAVVAAGARPRTVHAPAVAAFAAAAALALALEAYDRHVYAQAEDWGQYRRFNVLLGEFMDRGRGDQAGPEVEAAVNAAGWSANDFALFRSWFHPDPEVFGADRLSAVLERLPPAGIRMDRGRAALRRIVRSSLLPPVLLSLLSAVLVVHGDRRRSLSLLAACAAAAAATLWLAFWSKLPGHVWLWLVASPIAVPLAMGVGLGMRPARLRLAGATALATAALGWAAVVQVKEVPERVKSRRDLQRSLRSMRGSGDLLLVTWGPTFPYDVFPPFQLLAHPPGLRLFSLGWPQRTPIARKTLAGMGIQSLPEALFWDPRVRLAAPPEVAAMLERYARSHLGTEVRMEVAAVTPSFPVLQAVRPQRISGAVPESAKVSGGSMLESSPAAPQ